MFANIGAKKNTHEFLLTLVAQSCKDKHPQEDILPKKEEEKKEVITMNNSNISNIAAGVAILSGPTTPVKKSLDLDEI
jgi:hypothetical protein